MIWRETPGDHISAPLSSCGHYTISHRREQFTVSYRPPGEHHHVGTGKTIEEAKDLARVHAIKRGPVGRYSTDDLRVGDEFYAPPTSRRSSLGGTITKVNRVNFTYTHHYELTGEMMTLTARKDDLRACGNQPFTCLRDGNLLSSSYGR